MSCLSCCSKQHKRHTANLRRGESIDVVTKGVSIDVVTKEMSIDVVTEGVFIDVVTERCSFASFDC